jgi:hypothetical protein
MLKLCDLIELTGVKLCDFKIHLATGRNPTPMEAFLDGKFKEWQELQTKRNFQCSQVLALIQMQPARWLFAGVFKVHGVRPTTFAGRPHFRYQTTQVKGLEHLVGRAVVSFKRDFRASYLVGRKYADQLLVAEILGQKVSVGDFPGYRGVLLSHRVLQTVAREELPAWKAALSSVYRRHNLSPSLSLARDQSGSLVKKLNPESFKHSSAALASSSLTHTSGHAKPSDPTMLPPAVLQTSSFFSMARIPDSTSTPRTMSQWVRLRLV